MWRGAVGQPASTSAHAGQSRSGAEASEVHPIDRLGETSHPMRAQRNPALIHSHARIGASCSAPILVVEEHALSPRSRRSPSHIVIYWLRLVLLIMKEKQSDPEINKLDNYRASSYISYQGNKLSRRFNAYSYWLLTKAMDSHNIARNRGGDLKKTLTSIPQRTLIVGITSDILCPLAEQEFLADNMPNSTLISIDSLYGHDGFMVETERIGHCLKEWMELIIVSCQLLVVNGVNN